MKKARRFVKRWWWTFLLGAGVVTFVLWRLVRKPGGDGKEAELPPVFLEVARDEVARAQLEAEVEKARVTATADADRAEIDRIETLSENEPREGRRQMADWLSRNL